MSQLPVDLTLQDRVKRLYQRTFGGGHMIVDPGASLAAMTAEVASLLDVPGEEPLFEPIGGGYCRMHLRPLMASGLSLETANALFVYSANRRRGNFAAFQGELMALATSRAERDWLEEYRAMNCPALSHSDAYRARYRPAYRVVLDIFARPDAQALLLRLDTLGEGIVAIDGPCASGKSSLAGLLGEVFAASVLHIDDFFLRPEQRTPERLAQPGGNFDRERFQAEALTPMLAGGGAAYRPYSCARQRVEPPVWVERTPLVIVEGVYCLHPDLRDAYALKVFCDVDSQTQRERLLRRNGPDMLQRFENEWIPLENAYFDALGIRDLCDLRLRLENDTMRVDL